MSRRRVTPLIKTVDPPGDDAVLTDPAAACRNHDPDLFFGDGLGLSAKDICRRCPLIEPCREYAVARPLIAGVWGGTTGNERDRIRKHRKDGNR